MAYHLWCGSAKFQHEQQKHELFKFDQRIKKLEGETRNLERKVHKGFVATESLVKSASFCGPNPADEGGSVSVGPPGITK